MQKPAAAPSVRKKPAGASKSRLGLLEICAYRRSQLSHEWAKRGESNAWLFLVVVGDVMFVPVVEEPPRSAVRIAHRQSRTAPEPGPAPTKGRALTWHLDLHEPEDRKLLSRYITDKQPRDIWTSPACTAFTPMQNVNLAKKRRAGRRRWRPSGEQASLNLLAFLKKTRKANIERGGRSHHEQSAASRAPCDGGSWPWAISSDFEENTASVAGCSVGLMDHLDEKPLAKQWRVESTSAELLSALTPYKCAGGHEHGISLGNLERTASYTPFFCTLVAEVLLKK